MEEKKYWVGFNHVKGIGAVRFQRLQHYFRNLEDAWNATAGELLHAGIGEKAAENLHRFKHEHDLDKIYESILQQEIQIITTGEESYPARLLQIANPPPVLYVRGKISEQDQQAIAVVGTRKVTSYGKSVVRDLGGIFAHNNVTIVSGLARGVDSEAHRAILKAGGRTLAVMGSGVDVIYPPENAQLAQEIIENGAIISDYAPGTQPEGVNFPPRNRIIAGLSLATVVIEAGERSGALITASFTADQGKDVFAVPGSIYAPQSKGTNKLIFDGAYPLIQYDSIFEILDLQNVQYQHTMQRDIPTDEVEILILKLLQNEAMHIDDLQAATGLPVSRISSALTILELKGHVKNTGNMTYSANYELKEEYV
ncbi:MAG TPA: DNA-protecting protein DprA [Anaerolineaceae bacterium]|uniref:Putative DNA processing protein n=1 Tax=Anaerolinea thermophila TaxID=167964 RepID=A0A101FWQ2_9CHLR|nr:MAG: Putative DNA processing protein [Anaerolinea thermophila]HAF62061.1 DNA-protecting protein DprA [Anaerolineaceae bacterium]